MAVLIFIIGACFGSFYLVIGKRLPIKENAVNSRSKCDKCGHILSWWELIPILSYVFLLGKCHHCHKRVSILNLIIEIVTGSFFLFSYLYYGFSYEMFTFIIVSSLMTIIFITDFSYLIILDSPLIISSIIMFILRLCYKGINNALIYLIPGIALFITMYLIKLLGDILFKKESLGGGDIKFAFVIGYVLGFRLGLCALILSTFIALPYSVASLMLKKNNEVPYGPFLAASLFIAFLFENKFFNLLDLIFSSL